MCEIFRKLFWILLTVFMAVFVWLIMSCLASGNFIAFSVISYIVWKFVGKTLLIVLGIYVGITVVKHFIGE